LRALKTLVISTIFMVILPHVSVAKETSIPVESLVNKWGGDLALNRKSEFFKVLTAKTDGKGKPMFLGADLKKSVDVRNKYVSVFAKVDHIENWFGIELRLSSQAGYDNYLAIPIDRYSDPEFNILQEGTWQEITFSLGESYIVGDVDISSIKHVGLYIQDKSKGSFELSLSSSIVIKQSLTKGIVSMTFDDSYDEHYLAAEIMAQYGLRGTAYVMPRDIGRKGYLTEQELIDMDKEFGWGISMHHITPFTQQDPTTLQKEIEFGLDYLRGLGLFRSAGHLALPLGKINEEYVMPLVRRYFDSARIAGGGGETLMPGDWHKLRTFNVVPSLSAEDVMERVNKAKESGEWLILMFHYLVEGEPTQDLEYNVDEFEKLSSLLSASDLRVLPVHEVYEEVVHD
jgi:peptidoglycan/xylan/chitin deacetylase (PgdA/CDA1 family)